MADDITDALEKLDAAIRYACDAMNANGAIPDTTLAHVANWSVVVDERLYERESGKYLTAGVGVMSRPEQPGYISEAIIKGMAAQYDGYTYVTDEDDD